MKTHCYFIVILLLFGVLSELNAQDYLQSSGKNEWHVGLGLGIPYGRTGLKVNFNPKDQIGVFAGIGYWLTSIGGNDKGGLAYNLGTTYTLKTHSRTECYFLGSYGINSVLDANGFAEVYQGISLGAGMKLNSKKKKGNFWDFGVVFPFRNRKYKDELTKINNSPNIQGYIESHFSVTIAYNFSLSK
jgi:hypothetical protein